MPRLIVQEMRYKSAGPAGSLEKFKKTKTKKRTPANADHGAENQPEIRAAQNRYRMYDPAARRLMWIGVTIFSVIIVVLWGWALRLNIAFTSWDDLPEKQFFAATQNSWDTAFKITAGPISDTDKTKLKELLAALAASSTATTTATSTVSTPSTP